MGKFFRMGREWGRKEVTAFSAKFIVQMVFRAALRASGMKLPPAFPTKPATPLILTLTPGAFHLIEFHNRSDPSPFKMHKVFPPLSAIGANPVPIQIGSLTPSNG
jgi:hypothetical protein